MESRHESGYGLRCFAPANVWNDKRSRMQIDDTIRKNVVFIGIESDGQFTPLGTGSLGGIRVDGTDFLFLVTANHVVDSIAGEEIFVRLNRKSGGCDTLKYPKSRRMPHPNLANDVAVFNVTLDPAVYDFQLISLDRQQCEKDRREFWEPGTGDEVVAIGLYTSHYGLTKNIPVVRVGHIAALPDESVRTEFGYVAAYLIETKSIAGLSGSPVFLSVPQIKISDGDLMISKQKTHPIIGVLVGYHVVETKEDQIAVPQFQQNNGSKAASAERGVDERNTGFAVVIPIERIFDILEKPELVATMKAWVQQNVKKASGPSSQITASKSDNPSHTEARSQASDA